MVVRLVYLLVFACLWVGCKKPEDRTCWKKRGDDAQITLSVPSGVERLVIRQKLALKLIQDTTQAPYLKVSGGENLIDHISAGKDGSWLVIEDNNKCSFIRKKKDAVQLELNIHDLKELVLDNGANVTNEDSLRFEDMKITVESYATGDVDLTFDVDRLQYQNYQGESVVNLVFRGRVDHLSMEHNGYGTLNTRDGLFNRVDIIHHGINDVFVKGDVEINAQVKSRGDIFVYGNGVLNEVLDGSGSISRP